MKAVKLDKGFYWALLFSYLLIYNFGAMDFFKFKYGLAYMIINLFWIIVCMNKVYNSLGMFDRNCDTTSKSSTKE